ncbi:hypothetical protein TNCV_4546911 [Trichonephila clavipes]|nr:hypothetical protein TNCV_4546911 [Trichonephila clavipes]
MPACGPGIADHYYRACLRGSGKGNCNSRTPFEDHPENEKSVTKRVGPIATRTYKLVYFKYIHAASTRYQSSSELAVDGVSLISNLSIIETTNVLKIRLGIE